MNIVVQFKRVISGLFDFLKSPRDYKYPQMSSLDKYMDVLILVIIKLLTVMPIGFLIHYLKKFDLITVPSHIGERIVDSMPVYELFFVLVILAPLVEEFISRGFIVLRRFYPLLLYIDLREKAGKSRFSLLKKAKIGWNRIFPFLVIISSLLFGLVHIWNYGNQVSLWLIPLLISPQVIGGFYLAYARVRYGLVWSMIMHATGNFVLMVLQYVAPMG